MGRSLSIWQILKLCSYASQDNGHLGSRGFPKPQSGGVAEHYCRVLRGLQREGQWYLLARATQGRNSCNDPRAVALFLCIFLVRSAVSVGALDLRIE